MLSITRLIDQGVDTIVVFAKFRPHQLQKPGQIAEVLEVNYPKEA